MRISDWSSDVCSSDLYYREQEPVAPQAAEGRRHRGRRDGREHPGRSGGRGPEPDRGEDADVLAVVRQDRKSVGEGKSVSGRVVLGGGRIIKKKSEVHI